MTAIQRWDSTINLDPHYHALFLDGVYVARSAAVAPVFRALPPPSDEELLDVVARTARRVAKLVPGIADGIDADQLADDQPLLAHCATVALSGCAALGEPGGGIALLNEGTTVSQTQASRPRSCVALAGFSLHAATRVRAQDRRRLERLCRYITRPPLSNARLHDIGGGKLAYELTRPWSDTLRYARSPDEPHRSTGSPRRPDPPSAHEHATLPWCLRTRQRAPQVDRPRSPA